MPFAKDFATFERVTDTAIQTIPILPASEKPDNPAGGSAPRASSESKKDQAELVPSERRTEAERLIREIGVEFVKLRRKGRSAAWADLENKVATSGYVLISTGMITSKDWVGMMIDIEQFRKAEGGTEELPGDALAKWLSESEEAANKKKTAKKVPVVVAPEAS